MATDSGRIEQTCEECGETFSAYPSRNRKYCSHDCYSQAKTQRIETVCEECGDTFTVPPSDSDRRFCSRECSYSHGFANYIPDEELIADLKRVADELGETPTINEYYARGEYSHTTYQQHFGSWADACEAAGLEPNQSGGKRYEGHERTGIRVYGFEKNRIERARDIMEERHGERFPLHIVVAHLAELYIDEFGDGATEEAADGD